MRKSKLSVSRGEIATEIGKLLGRDRAQAIRAGARHDPYRERRAPIADSAWHPATQLTHRGTSSANARGSAEDRRRRKMYLLNTWGNGHTVTCAFDGCETVLTFATLTVDRFPVRGKDGGGYTRDNIRPACAACNYEDGGRNTPRKGSKSA